MASRAVPALTFWRPWPTLILHHGKDVENRTWTTAYRGPLLVHAGKNFDDVDDHLVQRHHLLAAGVGSLNAHPLGIVGVVDLVGVCSRFALSANSGVTCCSGWAVPGNYHWRLANPRPFSESIPCRGQQGFWFPPNELLERVDEAMVGASRG